MPVRARSLPFLALGLALASAVAAAPAPPISWMEPNDLRVVLAQEPQPAEGSPARPAHLILFIQEGTDDDPADARGAVEAAISSVAAGSEKLGWRELQDELRRIHATLTPHVASRYSILHLRLEDPAQLGDGLVLLSELVRHPAFAPTSLDAACESLTEDLLDLDAEQTARRVVPPLAWGHVRLPPSASPPERRRGPDRRGVRSGAAPDAGGLRADPREARLPDPWTLRSRVTDAVRDVYRRGYRPHRALLAVSGVPEQALRSHVASTLATWQAEPPPERTKAPSVPAGGPRARVAVIPSPGRAAMALALSCEPNAEGHRLERHAIMSIVADALGARGAVGAPWPASGTETIALPLGEGASAATHLARAEASLRRIARSGPTGDELAAWKALVAEGHSASLSTDGYPPFWAGLAVTEGANWDLAATAAALSADRIRRVAAESQDRGGIVALLAVPPAEAAVIARRMHGVVLDPLSRAPVPGSPEMEGRRILEEALRSQGAPATLDAIANIDERAEGMFHGIGTHVAVRTRLVATPPDRVYVESVMYNHDRFIVNRLIDGGVWVDRSGTGTRQEHRFDKARLLAREVAFHPAIALRDASREGLVRLASKATEPGGMDMLEVVHPLAGFCRFGVRASDRALARVEMDLAPLEASWETHSYDDFRVVEGVRVPFTDSATASERPLKDVTLESIAFPATVDQSIYLTPGQPPKTAFRPGRPDGTPSSAEDIGRPPE